MTGKLIKIAAIAALVGSAAGCAHNDELKAQINDAMQAAKSAQSTANSAQTTAESASQKADRAMKAAQDAKSCCQANSKRIDRAFERSQRK